MNVMTISSTILVQGKKLFDSGVRYIGHNYCASLWFSSYLNLTLVLDDYLAKYSLRRI